MNLQSYTADTLPELYANLVPTYKSGSRGRPFVATVKQWENRYGEAIQKINPKRARNRSDNYIDRREIQRIRGRDDYSFRFGVSKSGRGYHGIRGDFCLSSAAVSNQRHLTLFYRSLELIGGFGYDLTLVNELEQQLATSWKSVTFVAVHAYVFALKRNSNEKLYPKLLEIFHAGS
jgi:hypothetical protein